MTESTLPPPLVGADDKASLHQSDAQETAGPAKGAEADVVASTTNGKPPALETVTVSELLAARELTATPLVTTALPEADKGSEADAGEPGAGEVAGVAEIAVAEAAEVAAAEPATRAAVVELPPAEADRKPSPPPVDTSDTPDPDGGSPRSPPNAPDAPAGLLYHAEAATAALAPTPADAWVAEPLPAGPGSEAHAPDAAPPPDPIAVDHGPSLAKALEDAARTAAETETGAAATGERAAPAPDAAPADSGASPLAPVPAAAAGAAGQHFTSAFDAAAKLAADANAAAAALESLKRLLQRQQLGVPVGLAQAEASADGAAWSAPPPKRAEPPPLPSLALPATDDRGADDVPDDDEPQLPVPLARRRAPERVRFDLRGFLAGFALSWAFGVVLYLFMTAG